ncbi:MAG: hypothetical protein ACLFSC_07705 [Wenzhouxiangella sp.]
MALPDPASQARLAAIGIELWRRRESPARDAGETILEARVRLASGDGAWLLVQKQPWDGRQATLVADITALLGVEQCRFGQWSGGSAAGLALSELADRGIEHVLAFGPLPVGAGDGRLIQAASLDELATSAAARRALWQDLRPALGG